MPTVDIHEEKPTPVPEGQGGKSFRPIRTLNMDELNDIDISSKYSRFRRVQKNTPDAQAPVSGVPKQVFSMSASESPVIVQNKTVSLLSVIFTRDGHDTHFGGVKVYLTGYKGNTQPVAIGDAHESPCSFLVESTNENVVVTVQAIGQDGTPAAFDKAPTTHVLLDGVISAPPAPSISQTLTSVPLGYQFSFNQVSGLTADVVSAYNIWRNSVDSVTTATVIDTKVQDPLATGAIVVQDYPGANHTYYYYVSSINTAKLQSALVSAQSGAIVSGVVGSASVPPNLPSNTANKATVDSIDAGASATIRVYGSGGVGTAWDFIKGDGTVVSYPAASITGKSYTTAYYVLYDTSISSYITQTSFYDTQNDNYVFAGNVTTVAGGGGGGTTGGGGGGGSLGGCTEVGTELIFPPDSEITLKLEPCSDWTEVKLPDRPALFIHPDTLVSVFKKGSELQAGDRVEIEDGNWLCATSALPVKRDSMKQVVRVKPMSTYRAKKSGIRLHNRKPI